MSGFKNTLIQITRNGIGKGDDELSIQLAINYLKLLSEEKDPPKFIALYNGGVFLACCKSPAIEVMKTLEKKGVKIIACKTCIYQYNLIDELDVGIAATMADIIDLQKVADKVISL